MKPYNCLHCGKENKWKGSSHRNKYCDLVCHNAHKKDESVRAWLQEGKFSKLAAKRYLAEQREGCWTCGITEWQNKPLVLDLEHIDGDSDNNAPENLSLLCPNCHSQTDTYKGKNVGNGRHSRRLRYAAGKSY